jgi:hypothetical protein
MLIRLSQRGAGSIELEIMQVFKTQVIHRLVKIVDYAISLGFRWIRGAGLELSTCCRLPGL